MEEILIIEDDPDIQNLLTFCFEREAMPFSIASYGGEALEMVKKHTPSLILLDVMLPDMDGFELCKMIRMHTNNPILFLSCKNTDNDKILGLSIGADDYIEKPFNIEVLIARIRAHLRRNRLLKKKEQINRYLDFGNLRINIQARELFRNNEKIHLTSKEFELLLFLMKQPDQVFTAEQMLEKIWGFDTLSEKRTVVVHISSLRKKIEEDPLNPRHIITVRGVGYKFVLD
ncbi:response regulator transcription factor [Neobacillus mesonae]|uniref:response regulator transcription factor n=1 Tax=Neobacillus mesonae TaxID=1193713 RepID=UPI002573D058|nr:response regulator transcription factor [Neobacillus mesonae]MED4204955.1 response regulator transcription factor [Neobacillus mesonae]